MNLLRCVSLGLFLSVAACSSSSGAPAPTAAPSSTGTPTPPTPPAPSSQGLPSKNAAELSATLRTAVSEGIAPGVSLAIDHPKYGRWSGASGVADTATGEALTPSHRFRAGSMMKPLVAAAVLRLVEAGQLSLDATLARVLPETITTKIHDASQITVRMLLDHTSGIPDFANGDFDRRVAEDPTHRWTLTEELDRVAAQPASFAPGAGWAYSNTDYVLLGAILEATTGQPWRSTLAASVIAPAKMADTTLPPEGTVACSGCSRGYEEIDGKLRDLTEVDPSMAGAAGGGALVTSTADMVSFLRALTAGSLFSSKETTSQLMTFVAAPLPEEGQVGYGLGVARFQVGETTFVGHLGGTAGYHGFVLHQPESGVIVSGYMNRRGDLGAFLLPVLEAVAHIE